MFFYRNMWHYYILHTGLDILFPHNSIIYILKKCICKITNQLSLKDIYLLFGYIRQRKESATIETNMLVEGIYFLLTTEDLFLKKNTHFQIFNQIFLIKECITQMCVVVICLLMVSVSIMSFSHIKWKTYQIIMHCVALSIGLHSSPGIQSSHHFGM